MELLPGNEGLVALQEILNPAFFGACYVQETQHQHVTAFAQLTDHCYFNTLLVSPSSL